MPAKNARVSFGTSLIVLPRSTMRQQVVGSWRLSRWLFRTELVEVRARDVRLVDETDDRAAIVDHHELSRVVSQHELDRGMQISRLPYEKRGLHQVGSHRQIRNFMLHRKGAKDFRVDGSADRGAAIQNGEDKLPVAAGDLPHDLRTGGGFSER